MKKAEPKTQESINSPAAAPAPAPTPAPQGDAPEALLRVEAATLTPQQLDELKARAAKADEHWDRLLRTAAELENFKKRAARERQDAVKFANETLLQRLIPILDAFEMAQSAAQNTVAESLQSLHDGIAMIQQQLKNALAEAGLEEVDATGKLFDPALHEAVSQHESADLPEGSVVQQLRKGYKLRERLLRPATVIVAKKPAEIENEK
jgi:molecular chaperone GrpE